MIQRNVDENCLCMYAMDVFFSAGHVATCVPVFENHSSKQFVYFDNSSVVSLSREQRRLLALFDNVSHLFDANGCVFLSIDLFVLKNCRSQLSHDIHSMLHQLIGSKGSVVLFRCDEEIMLSFIGFGLRCILSDWYAMDDDYHTLVKHLDIGNLSVESQEDYFLDMVYFNARSYYLSPKAPVASELIPVYAFTDMLAEEMERDDLDVIIENELLKPQRNYGDDYVDYYNTASLYEINSSSYLDLDMMLLEMDAADEAIDDPFGELVEAEYYDDPLDDEEGLAQDEYEFDYVDPEIFRDPALMVKWIQKEDKQED